MDGRGGHVRIERRLDTPRWLVIGVPVASMVAALVVGGIALALTGRNPLSAYSTLFQRGFLSQSAFTSTLRSATPLVFAGLAAAAAFRLKVWNIGGEGQLYMGAIGASGVGLVMAEQPGVVLIPAMIVAGIVAGALWALIPGVLRAYYNTNEIITSLMLNFVAGLFLGYLVLSSLSLWRDQSEGASTFPLGARLPAAATWPVFGTGSLLVLAGLVLLIIIAVRAWADENRISLRRIVAGVVAIVGIPVVWNRFDPGAAVVVPLGLCIGVVAAVLAWVLYRETRFGFEVRVMSDSPQAAMYSGMNTRRKIITVMLLSGGLAGLGGASQVGDFSHLLDPYGIPQSGYGYAGIVAAALARNNPLGVVLTAFLLGGLSNAGFSLRGLDFPLGLVGMLQGLVLFFAVGGELFVRYRLRFSSRLPEVDSSPGHRDASLATTGPEGIEDQR